jgi:transposase
MKLNAVPDDFAAYIGIDWADRKHDISLYDPQTQSWSHTIIQSTPEAIADWVNQLRQRYGTAKLLVGLEQKRGPLLYALCRYDNLVLVPINPRTVANYRKAFQPSRAKSDPIDAKLIVELMQRHGDKLDVWTAGCPQHRALRQWVEARRMLVGEKVRVTNRITAALKSYFPQVLDWFVDKDTLVFCDFLTQFADLDAVKALTLAELTTFFKPYRIRHTAVQRRFQQIQASTVPMTQDAAIIVPAQALVQALVALLRTVIEQLRQFEQAIDTLFETLPDAAIFQALPGAGPHLAPRLLAAFGNDRSRFDSAQSFMSYVGIAPVKEESGKKRWVHWRWSCPIFLRQTFVEWVEQARRHSAWSQAFYQQQRAAGKSHQKAIRALAYKWGRILWRCWQDGKPYDEAKYLAALRRKKSPLIGALRKAKAKSKAKAEA